MKVGYEKSDNRSYWKMEEQFELKMRFDWIEKSEKVVLMISWCVYWVL